MAEKRMNDDLVEIDGRVRIERGPARRTGKATEALLSDDRTASHYAVGARDAAGKVIELGQPMAYLDHLGARGFYVYALSEAGRWAHEGFFEDEAAARTRAGELLKA